jgi:maltose/maltodextrin transport system permease protein
MVTKKHHYFTHFMLIIIIAVVLFPLIWVFTTSIRRDNAAFSTEIVSSRLTLQHYKELLFKPKNIPSLISDMKLAINISSQYKRLTESQIQREVQKYSDTFEKTLDHAQTCMSQTDTDLDILKAFFLDKRQEVLERFFASRPEIQKSYLSRYAELSGADAKAVKILDYFLLEAVSSKGYIPELLPVLETRFPELHTSYLTALEQRAIGLARSAQLLEELCRRIDSQLSDTETIGKLESAFEAFEELLDSNTYSYTKWLREISIKVFNTLNIVLENPSQPQISEMWMFYKEDQKSFARSVDDTAKTLKELLVAMLNDVNSLKKYEFDDPLLEWKHLLQTQDETERTIRETQTRINQYNEKLSELSNRISLFDVQIEMQISFQDKASEIIRSFFTQSEKQSSDPFVKETFRAFVKEAEDILSALVFGKSDESNATIPSVSRLENAVRFIKENQDKIRNYTGYSAINDATAVYRNTFIVLIPLLGELQQLTKEYADLQYEKALSEESYRVSLTDLEEIKLKINAGLPTITKKQEILFLGEQLLSFSRLKSILNQVVDWSSLKQWFTSCSEYISRFPAETERGISVPDPVIGYLSQLETLVGNLTDEKQRVSSTIRVLTNQIEELKKRSASYISLRKKGAQVKVLEIEEIENVYTSAFNDFSSSLNRSARRSSDLSKIPLFDSVRGALRNIDKQVYDFMQFWDKKPEQYFMLWLLNSVIVATITSLLTVVVCALGAYPFSRMRFPGRKNGLLALILLQMFPSIMSMVALYSLLRFTGKLFPFLGLDTIGGLIFIYLGSLPFNMWLLKGYFDTIPDSMEEAARIDGATRFQTFYKIVIPLSVPILAVVFILCFMSTFNEFVLARIMLQNPQNYTFAVGLQSFANGPYQMEWGLFTAAALIGAIPMVVVFLFMQKYLVGGLTSGAVKG